MIGLTADTRATPGQPWIIDAAIYVHLAYQTELSDSKRNEGPIATLDPGVSRTGPRLASMIRELLDRFGFDTAIAAWNGSKDVPQWRTLAAPSYKANRPQKAPGLRDLLDAGPRIFAELGIGSVLAEGYEADDVIASAVHRHPGCVIVSNDKDFYQLLGVNGCRIWDPRKRRNTAPKGSLGADEGPAGAWIALEDVIEKFGVPPERVIDVQAIMGDSADGVPGAHGVGVKGASTLIGTFGDLASVLELDPASVSGGIGATLAKVHASRDKVELARRLVTLATDLEVPVYPVTPRARTGIGAMFNPRNLESNTMSNSPFARILGPQTPSLKDRLNAEAAASVGVPAPPPPAPPAPKLDATRAAIDTAARQYASKGEPIDNAFRGIVQWAAHQSPDVGSAECERMIRAIYAELTPAPTPAPGPAPAAHYSTDSAGADVVRSMIRMQADKAARAGVAQATAIAEAQRYNAERPPEVRLNAGEVEQAVIGTYAATAKSAPPAPAPAPAPAVAAPAPGPINPPDGVPAHLPATEYAPGGAMDPNRKSVKDDLLVPPGFGEFSGRTWTSIVKDDAILFRLRLLDALAAAGADKQARYRGNTNCPEKGAKRSEVLPDCKLLCAILLGAALPEGEERPPVEAPAPAQAPVVEAPAPMPVATIPEPAPRPTPPASDLAALAARDQASAPAPAPEPAPPVVERKDEPEYQAPGAMFRTLYVDCAPVTSIAMWLHELVEDHGIARKVADELGVRHYGIAEYRKGARGIAAYVDELVRFGGVAAGLDLIVDTRLDYASECLSVLLPLAERVVRRLA